MMKSTQQVNSFNKMGSNEIGNAYEEDCVEAFKKVCTTHAVRKLAKRSGFDIEIELHNGKKAVVECKCWRNRNYIKVGKLGQKYAFKTTVAKFRKYGADFLIYMCSKSTNLKDKEIEEYVASENLKDKVLIIKRNYGEYIDKVSREKLDIWFKSGLGDKLKQALVKAAALKEIGDKLAAAGDVSGAKNAWHDAYSSFNG